MFAPNTIRLKAGLGGEVVEEGRDDGFAAPTRDVHHHAVGDAGFAAFVAHLPSAELFIGPLQSVAMPFVHAAHTVPLAFAPLPVPHATGFAGPTTAAAAPPPSITQAEVNALATGFANTLSGLEANLIAQVFAQNLPVLGDNLAPLGRGTDRRNLTF